MVDGCVSEESFQTLFNGLPKRCVVLLEDIDEAGLVNRELDLFIGPKEKPKEKKEESESGKSKDGEKEGEKNEPEKPVFQPITLSGLLNVIDGVASHEGRVLIMTSNCPDKLDPALVRPGRIDMKVEFTLATKSQIKDIFLRMYAPVQRYISLGIGYKANDAAIKTIQKIRNPIAFERDELEPLANDFAELVPDRKFSPAEVQNFLIARKKDPSKAVAEVELWVEAELDIKKKKSEELKAKAEEEAKAKAMEGSEEDFKPGEGKVNDSADDIVSKQDEDASAGAWPSVSDWLYGAMPRASALPIR